jgi:hypothetical protein
VPPYISSSAGNNPVQLLQLANPNPGPPGYAFGSRAGNLPTTKMLVTNVAVTGGTATVTVTVFEGNIPSVGSLISIVGTSAGSGAFNVTNAVITAVTISAVTGGGTIQFALGGTVGSVSDNGNAYVPTPEVAEALAVGKSQAFAISGYGLSWSYTLPVEPASIAIQLEGAINNTDGEFTIIGSSVTAVPGTSVTIGTLPELVRFVRLNVTAVSGGVNPTIIAKIQST